MTCTYSDDCFITSSFNGGLLYRYPTTCHCFATAAALDLPPGCRGTFGCRVATPPWRSTRIRTSKFPGWYQAQSTWWSYVQDRQPINPAPNPSLIRSHWLCDGDSDYFDPAGVLLHDGVQVLEQKSDRNAGHGSHQYGHYRHLYTPPGDVWVRFELGSEDFDTMEPILLTALQSQSPGGN